jgi:PEP-CTERM motif
MLLGLRNLMGSGGLALALVALPVAHGGTVGDPVVDINSGFNQPGEVETNNKTGNDVIITDPDPTWAPSGTTADGNPYVWVSYADTGFKACLPGNSNPAPCPPNTTVTGTPSAIFAKSFDLPNSFNTGSLSIWADDTAAVYLNGPGFDNVELMAPDGNLGAHCASGVIGCMAGNDATFNFGNGSGDISLPAGVYTLVIDVYQLGGGPFGVMYGGEINSNSVPEPASYALFGLGLFGLMIVAPRLRKRA